MVGPIDGERRVVSHLTEEKEMARGKNFQPMTPLIGERERERGEDGSTYRRRQAYGGGISGDMAQRPLPYSRLDSHTGAVGLKSTWATVPLG
jgi:hypothetical protein